MSRDLNNKFFENRALGENSENSNNTVFGVSRDEWLTSKEAAEYLRISVGSFRNMVCNGVIKPRAKVGRLNRFHIHDLINFLINK